MIGRAFDICAYNADLHVYGTTVVDNSVLKQSGKVFARGPYFLPCLVWLYLAFEKKLSLFFRSMLLIMLAQLYVIGGV